MMLRLTSLAVVLTILASPLQAKEQSQVIKTNKGEYQVVVHGTRGPVNEAIVIENVGDKDIINPRIKINPAYKNQRSLRLVRHRFDNRRGDRRL
jgi:hypothetical protein